MTSRQILRLRSQILNRPSRLDREHVHETGFSKWQIISNHRPSYLLPRVYIAFFPFIFKARTPETSCCSERERERERATFVFFIFLMESTYCINISKKKKKKKLCIYINLLDRFVSYRICLWFSNDFFSNIQIEISQASIIKKCMHAILKYRRFI